MAHSHAHSDGETGGNYFLDQLFTILTCGGVGLVAVLMYQTGMLSRILVPMFFVPVLLGGIAILALVVIRAIALWQLAGARRMENLPEHADNHEHAHGHGHSHSHGNEEHESCGHDHSHGADGNHDRSHSHAAAGDDHGHDHGWAPWRYMVLAIPVFLYFLGLPRDGLSMRAIEGTTSRGALQSPNRDGMAVLVGGHAFTKVLRKPDPRRMQLKFKELTEAAAIPARHDIYDGDIGILRGQFVPLLTGGGLEFTLLRVDMTCCVADQIYLETRIIAPSAIQGIEAYQWVRVEGLISFQRNEKGKWIPVITLASNNDISTNVEPTGDANIP
jgi:hypothetical protein